MLQDVLRWYFEHNGSTADMDELTVFQYFLKLQEFGGLQNTPNRFENRFQQGLHNP